ncbi:MAG: hypothetical protein DWQ36_17415 [Acidobacteria bacterium]|nr:MAG: hypothetical protein DWQ30_23230 [Acidobacteriota bacterium]REK04435.1 MAG: hypothetical protein DWQ36_17415 [Acidobacteriota bacterium]
MRTTLEIDDDVLRAARVLARERETSLGSVVSDLARRGLKAGPGSGSRSGLPVFEIREDAAVFGPEEVADALDEDF